jgi:PAS domain S-box-containing protein
MPEVLKQDHSQPPEQGTAKDAKTTRDDVLVTDEIRLRAYLEAALGGILAVNGKGCVVFMNGHTEQMFGYTRNEILGQDLMVLVPERFHGDYTSALHAYFAAPTVRLLGMEMNLAARRKNGEEFPVEIGLSFVEGHEGPIALGFITDVTERKRVSEELTRLNGELVRSNTELEHFANLVSHDLQEPLRVMTSYLALLDSRYHSKLTTEAGEFLGYVVDGASRMKAQIEDLLNFSRIGMTAPAFHRVNSGQMLQTAMDNLEAAIRERSAEVTWDPLPEIFVDPGLLAQVFQNLISNGVKFHKDGIPRVHVSATQQGSDWVFSVIDNGIGIEAHQSERVFQVFERLNAASEYPGTGVGLTISRKIVQRHKGRIWFESKPGEGTTFFFSIPQALTGVAESAAA